VGAESAQTVFSRLFDVHVDDFSKRIGIEKRRLDAAFAADALNYTI
jgi:hypothetical protein